jgi:hypothetical protein
MFKLRQLLHRNRARYAPARQTGLSLEPMHEEQMHNLCELNEKGDITWNAGLNL